MQVQQITQCSIESLAIDRVLLAKIVKQDGKWTIWSDEGVAYSPLRISITSRSMKTALCGGFFIHSATSKKEYKFKGISENSPTSLIIKVERIA